MALPTAIFATVASLGLASAAVMSSVDVQQGTKRDSDSKSAIAAADAGASVALLRLNRYASALTTSTPCLGLSGGTLVLATAAADGWCPEVSGTVGSSTYAYRVTPLVSGGTMSVVATGSDGSVARRIAIGFKTTTVGSVLSAEGVIGQEGITLANSATILNVGVGTNGDVSLTNSATICGNIREGIGKGPPSYANSAHQCSGYVATEGNVTLPAVSTFIPTDIATNNSNYRLVKCTGTNTPVGCGSDTFSSNNKNADWPWDATKREIALVNSSSLTLGGGDYFICRLSISNSSHLIMAAGSHVRIFFDTPENCSKTSTTQVDINNSSDITSTGYNSKLGQFDMPGLYLMGSTSKSTKATLGNSSHNEFLFYGPNTSVEINNSATFKGPIAAKKIDLSNSAVVERDVGYEPPAIGGATLYQRQSYVECVGATASPPNANC